MNFYAGIGSRETPGEVLDLMHALAVYLRADGWVLRSGGAEGADVAFEQGASQAKRIYLPWPEFNGSCSDLERPEAWTFEVAAKHHPAWERLSQGGQKLQARNVHQVLGHRGHHPNVPRHSEPDPSRFVICWTKDGKASGGTGQAIRIAEAYGIEVRNLHNPETREASERWLRAKENG